MHLIDCVPTNTPNTTLAPPASVSALVGWVEIPLYLVLDVSVVRCWGGFRGISRHQGLGPFCHNGSLFAVCCFTPATVEGLRVSEPGN